MLKEVWAFVKNPVYLKDDEIGFKHRISIFVRVLLAALAISITLNLFVETLEVTFQIETGEHVIIDMFKKQGFFYIFLVAVIIAPILEELIFRGPLIWFRKSKTFKYVFYFFTLVFGAVHLSNYESVVWFSLLLITPQISVGVFLGFIRVKFGLLWAMALHACYNLVLTGPIIIMKILNVPLE